VWQWQAVLSHKCVGVWNCKLHVQNKVVVTGCVYVWCVYVWYKVTGGKVCAAKVCVLNGTMSQCNCKGEYSVQRCVFVCECSV